MYYYGDIAGRLVKTTDSTGVVVDYRSIGDPLGRVTQIDVTGTIGGTTTAASGIAYEPFGPVNALTHGNGVRTEWSYDLNGRLTALDIFDGATPVLDLDYLLYDLAGNLKTIDDAGGGPRGRTYLYDELYRLKEAGGGMATETYLLDKAGNREERTVGGTPETLAYDAVSNRLDTVTVGATVRTLGYSLSGNIDSDDDGEESNVQAEELFSYLPDVSTGTAWAPSWSMTVESPQ